MSPAPVPITAGCRVSFTTPHIARALRVVHACSPLAPLYGQAMAGAWDVLVFANPPLLAGGGGVTGGGGSGGAPDASRVQWNSETFLIPLRPPPSPKLLASAGTPAQAKGSTSPQHPPAHATDTIPDDGQLWLRAVAHTWQHHVAAVWPCAGTADMRPVASC